MPHTPSDYETLNLPEGAPKEMVERKYGALLRAYKQRTDEYGVTEEDLAYYHRITEAYDRIVGTVHDFSDPNPTSVIPYKFRRVFYKLSANLEHYKFILVGLLMILVIVLIVFSQIKDVQQNDLHLKFVGAFTSVEQAELTQEINQKSQACESPDITFFTVTEETAYDSQAQNAALQFRMQFMSGAIEVILIDQANYDVYVDELAFLDLTDYLAEHEGESAFQGLSVYSHENTGEGDNLPSGIYGIEFTQRGSLYFDGMSLDWLNDYIKDQERSMILAICRQAQNQELAKEYLTELIVSTANT